MHKHTFHSVLLLLFAVAAIANAARIPPGWPNAVVAIGHTAAGPPGVSEWATEASGFFYGYLVRDDPDPSTRGYEVYRITDKHVIANHAQIDSTFVLGFSRRYNHQRPEDGFWSPRPPGVSPSGFSVPFGEGRAPFLL